MNTLRGRDCWPVLRIDDALLDELRAIHAAGMPPNEIITWLHAKDVTKPGATIALRLVCVMQPNDAKLAVHRHPAYAYRREADEELEQSVVDEVSQLASYEAA